MVTSSCGKIYRGEKEDFICRNCLEKEREQREQNKRTEYQIQTLLNLSNIPIRYENAIFKPKTEIQNRVSQYFIENFTTKSLKQSTDIVLFGAIGTGKTYLSCAFAIELITKRQNRVKYITEYELLSLYFEKRYQEFKSFRDSQILILDEMGKRVLAEWQRIQLEELLSSRYNDMLPTIYITNLEEIGFREFLGARLADRLRENRIQRFAFNGGSLRGGVV
jgi:DNA replication protein DnaC